MTSFPTSQTHAYPPHYPSRPAVESGRHSVEHLGHAAVPVTAYAPVPKHLPSGRRFRGIPGHLARVAYARAVRGQQ